MFNNRKLVTFKKITEIYRDAMGRMAQEDRVHSPYFIRLAR